MHDKFQKRHQAPRASQRVRHQIAVEAARRLHAQIAPETDQPQGHLREATEAEFYTAKRKAAAVLGHRVRPGDLPSDSEVREQVIAFARALATPSDLEDVLDAEPMDDREDSVSLPPLADRQDRFAIYRLRLTPLEAVKQNPRHHPEGDALFHSLQVFERAREVRPYDEEFLLAALLHDVGKAIDPSDPVASAVETLRGSVTERTLWLIEHQRDLMASRERALSQRARQALETSEYRDDLTLLCDLDEAGRVPGQPVGTVDQALAYLRGLENEDYLEP